MPSFIAGNRKANWPTNSVSPMASSSRSGTLGLVTKKTGRQATTKRSAPSSSGGTLSSPSRITTKLKPQMAVTRTASAMCLKGMVGSVQDTPAGNVGAAGMERTLLGGNPGRASEFR